ncbi:MAG TPA: hypothetical protein VNT27_11795, partial [Propionibacteriaceae bacterium]|nr:hypothetical protein [Propionibacteriaceae bacterium]
PAPSPGEPPRTRSLRSRLQESRQSSSSSGGWTILMAGTELKSRTPMAATKAATQAVAAPPRALSLCVPDRPPSPAAPARPAEGVGEETA